MAALAFVSSLYRFSGGKRAREETDMTGKDILHKMKVCSAASSILIHNIAFECVFLFIYLFLGLLLLFFF